MKEEMDSLEKKETWELVKLPKDRKMVGCKWVFKLKKEVDGKVERYKAKLVTINENKIKIMEKVWTIHPCDY